MPLKFDITLTAEDMYRFNMYQTYSGFHGWFSIAFSILIFVVAGVTRGKIEAAYTAVDSVFGIVFLVYPPVSLYLRSKRTLAMSEVLRGTLHYEVDEEGLHVSQKEESALLPWEQIYKMVATKHTVLVYSSRINAYVIPRAQLGESYAALQTQAAAHLPAYRLKMK